MRPLFLMLLLAAPAFAADPPPNPIRLPAARATDPQPMPGPQTPTKLDAACLYVIDSDIPVIVLASPPGVVGVTEETGPIRIRAKFADGPDTLETRTYAGKYVVTVEAAHKGTCELLVIPVGAKSAAEVIRRQIEVADGTAPQPPPKPVDPDVKPDPAAPIAGDGFRVLMVYESAALSTLPQNQANVLTSAEVRKYLNEKCVAGPDGKTREWRVLDQDVPTADESKTWQDALKRPRSSLPWVVISDGITGYEGPLPATVAETMALLRKYGG